MLQSKITCLCGLVATTAIAACSFSVNGGSDLVIDAAVDAIPDAGACTSLGPMCSGDVLRTCLTLGALPDEEVCDWACVETGGPSNGPHCGVFTPAGGSVTQADVTGTLDRTIMNGTPTIIDGNAGQIEGQDWPDVVMDATNPITVFRFNNLTINSTVQLFGARSIALVAAGNIVVNGLIEGRPMGCTPPAAGPGGFPGGLVSTDAAGSGGGGGGASNIDGGGGGGHGGVGGLGGALVVGTETPGGPAFGAPEIPLLTGGGGGGGGGDGGGPIGGGGGAGIQLVARGTITFTAAGAINAGGCGGLNAGPMDSGAGGGAGGTILLEARQVILQADAKLAVNGGSGGAGNGGTDGSPGTLERIAAPGGTVAGGANGGAGGAPGALDGGNGVYGVLSGRSGGGGGAIGRIRINTRSGAASIDPAASMSPSLTDAMTTATQGALDIK